MAAVKAKGQTIVDMYCGVGYYSLPFLVHAGAAFVHAFEWNPNSVAAFLINAKANGVKPDRLNVHFGDNNLAILGLSAGSATSDYQIPRVLSDYDSEYLLRDLNNETLEDSLKWKSLLNGVADRVCLGLLPSSDCGWIAGATVLKPSGGTLHVHFNVNESEIGNWVASACERWTNIFTSINKPMIVNCTHVEKVKWYAPRVRHIVADLECIPTSSDFS